MNVVVKRIKDLSSSDKKSIINFLIESFSDNPNYKNSVYTNSDLDICVLLYQNQKLIGHVGITRRLVEHKKSQYLVAGIGDVAIETKLRHSGFGTILMKEVNEVIKSDSFDLGLLFCHPKLDGFYSSCGWIKKENGKIYATVNNEKEDQRLTYFLPIKLDEKDLRCWNNDDVEVGRGSW